MFFYVLRDIVVRFFLFLSCDENNHRYSPQHTIPTTKPPVDKSTRKKPTDSMSVGSLGWRAALLSIFDLMRVPSVQNPVNGMLSGEAPLSPPRRTMFVVRPSYYGLTRRFPSDGFLFSSLGDWMRAPNNSPTVSETLYDIY